MIGLSERCDAPNLAVESGRSADARVRSCGCRAQLIEWRAYSTPSRTPFRSDGGRHSAVMADTGRVS